MLYVVTFVLLHEDADILENVKCVLLHEDADILEKVMGSDHCPVTLSIADRAL